MAAAESRELIVMPNNIPPPHQLASAPTKMVTREDLINKCYCQLLEYTRKKEEKWMSTQKAIVNPKTQSVWSPLTPACQNTRQNTRQKARRSSELRPNLQWLTTSTHWPLRPSGKFNRNMRKAQLSFIVSSCSWPKLPWRSENKSPTRSDTSQLPNSTASVTARRWEADIRILRDAQYLSAIANGGRSRYADMMAATCLAISLGDSSGASRSALLNSTITSGSGGGGGGGNGLASTAREGGKVYLQSVITECCHVLIVQIFIRVTISYIRIFMGLFCGIEQHRKK